MIRIDRPALAAAASAAARMAGTRAGMHEAWAEVRLSVKGPALTLTAMDSANRIELSVPCSGEMETVCVHACRFAEVVDTLPAEDVELDVEPGRLRIIGGRGKRSLATSLAEYPEPEFQPRVETDLDGARLREALAFALPHIADPSDPTKRTMSGVFLVSVGGLLRVVGTDAHEMGVIDAGECREAIGATINPKVAEFAATLLPDAPCSLRLSERQAEISWARGLIRGPLVAEEFPYRIVEHHLAKSYDESFGVEADAFLEALHSIRPIGELDAMSRSKRVKLTLNGVGAVSTRSTEGEAEQEFVADWQHEPLHTGFAAARMDRILRHFKGCVLSIGLDRGMMDRNTSPKAAAIRIEAAGKPDRLCLLFPLRL